MTQGGPGPLTARPEERSKLRETEGELHRARESLSFAWAAKGAETVPGGDAPKNEPFAFCFGFSIVLKLSFRHFSSKELEREGVD